MKYHFLVSTFAFFMLLLTVASAIPAETRFSNGFRGIPWGTAKEQLPDLGLSKKALKNIYKTGPSSVLFMEGKGNLELRFNDIELLSIFMHFQNQQFSGVDLLFKPEDRNKIVSIITAETGFKGSVTNGSTKWKTNNTEIVVSERELMVTSQN